MQKNQSYRAEKANKRSRIKAALARAARWGEIVAAATWKRQRYQMILAKAQKQDAQRFAMIKERERLMNSMTNWQRNQAGRACKGRWRNLSLEQLARFAEMPHPKQKRA